MIKVINRFQADLIDTYYYGYPHIKKLINTVRRPRLLKRFLKSLGIEINIPLQEAILLTAHITDPKILKTYLDSIKDEYKPKYVIEFVDLGLNSGTLWATCNLGATKPEEVGLYYAWAETEGYKDASKKSFYWDDYKWGTRNNFTKYTIASSTMLLTDDAAYNINDEAKIPTPTQVEELLSLTKVVESNGVRFIGNNGNEIFIPFSGNYYSGSLRETGTAFFWTNKLDSSFVNMGRALKADENYGLVTSDPGRCYGIPIRPVKSSETLNN